MNKNGRELKNQVLLKDCQDLTYSKQSHFDKFISFGEHVGVHPDYANLKFYQDLLAYNFIINNLPPGSKLLEVGGGNSRVIQALKQDYECWNIDKFEGVGNGPMQVNDEIGYQLVSAYIGDFSSELRENYFDCVFSISTLEHVPETEQTFKNVCNDINRVLKPGGLSLHCFDVVIHKGGIQTNVWTNGLLGYMFKNITTLNQMIPFAEMQLDLDLYVMSETAYKNMWQIVTQQTYEEFGKPLSYNVFWNKQAVSVSRSNKNELSGKLNEKKSVSSPSIRVGNPLPKISIVTPSFNQGEFLEECIDSILSQGYPNLEYIIMDGGSTDISVTIIKKYEKYLAYWQTQPDGGHYAALNAGFSKTTGEIMAWLNSDDKYHRDAFFKVVAAFAKNQQIEWLSGRSTTWNRLGSLKSIEILIQWSRDYILNKSLIEQRFIQQESTFWKRSLWEKAGAKLRADIELAGDFELWVRFYRYAEIFVVDDLIGGFRSHEIQRSKLNAEKYFKEVEQIVNSELQLITSGQYETSQSVPAPIVLTYAEISATKPKTQPNSDVLIVTTIAPGNIENQRSAINSWRALGFTVVSLNNQEEINQLQPIYKDVDFQVVNRDARVESGKPLVYIDDIFLYLYENGTKICGIVNSDILMKADDDFLSFIREQAENSLIVSSRSEISSPEQLAGKTYIYGLDVFFFDRRFAEHFPPSKFCLGLPWWDYFVPYIALEQGFCLKMIDNHFAYHISHPTNYSKDLWLKMGIYFTQFINNDLTDRFQNMYQNNQTLLDGELTRISLQIINMIDKKSHPLILPSKRIELKRLVQATLDEKDWWLRKAGEAEKILSQNQEEKNILESQIKAWRQTAEQLQIELNRCLPQASVNSVSTETNLDKLEGLKVQVKHS